MKNRLVFLFLALSLALQGFSQEPSESSFLSDEAQLSEISQYLNSDSYEFDNLLEETGFEKPKYFQPKDWEYLPIYKKLSIAYITAENHTAGNGSKMLALLAKNIALSYDAILYSPEIQKLPLGLSERNVGFKHFPSYPAKKLTIFNLSSIRKIRSILPYIDGGALGGTHEILFSYFGLDDFTIHKIMVAENVKTSEDALSAGLKLVNPPSKRREIVGLMKSHINLHYESLSFTRKKSDLFGRFRQMISRSEGLNGATTKNRGKVYEDFMKHHYPNDEAVKGRSFKKMIKKSGFGGIILGQSFSSKINEGSNKLVEVNWFSNSTERHQTEYGRLEFIFNDGRRLHYINVHLEEVQIIKAIMKAEDYNPKDGLGLISVGNSGFITFDEQWASSIVTHPMISNSKIGWACLYADLFPRHHEITAESFMQAHPSFFNDYNLNIPETSTLLFTDVPTEFIQQGNQISVIPQKSSYNTAYILRYEEAKISKKSFVYKEVDSFNEALPYLIRNNEYFQSLERFVKLYSLLRWVNSESLNVNQVPSKRQLYPELPYFFCTDDNKNASFRRIEDELNGYSQKRTKCSRPKNLDSSLSLSKAV